MDVTIKVIGAAIKDGSEYLPIRNRAAALATLAKPKDYFGQLKSIFNDFVKRWRYVRDPWGKELVTRSPEQIYNLVMGGRSEDPGVGFGLGAGDCDDATVAIGSMLKSIGFPVRIATMAAPYMPPGHIMNHVFCQAMVPGLGWLTVDPVVYPSHGLGWTPKNSRLAFYDLDGRIIGRMGNNVGIGQPPKERRSMYGYNGLGQNQIPISARIPGINYFDDLSGVYDGTGYFAGPDEDILDFRVYGVKDFGIYADTMGMTDMGDVGFSLAAEVETDEYGNAWTPTLEIKPEDYQYIRRNGKAYHGMLGLSDENEQYVYDGGLGFFKKLFRKIKKKVKKIGSKLLKKIPGGKFLMRLGKKIWKVAKKYVKPLVKLVGKWAPRLAPIAALIPGVGPAVSAAMLSAGTIAKLLDNYGTKIVNIKNAVSRLKFPGDKQAKGFTKALRKAAKIAQRKGLDKKFLRKLKKRRPSRSRKMSPAQRRLISRTRSRIPKYRPRRRR